MAHLTTPVRQHRETSTPLSGPSPHYVAGKRYALYGNEDRVVLDVGSKFIKYGFSSEAAPRGVLHLSASFPQHAPPLGLWQAQTRWTKDTVDKVKFVLQKALRKILQLELMLDARTRKIVIVEPPLWPRQIKAILASILFDNLQVPSVVTLPTHLCALLASGTTTGLVLDVGHVESTVLPVFASRPLYLHIQTTTCAGLRLLSRLRALLLVFGRYSPPPQLSITSSSAPINPLQPVPEELLTPEVLLDLLHRGCFVAPNRTATTDSTPIFTRSAPVELKEEYDEAQDDAWMEYLGRRYRQHASASSISLKVAPPPSASAATSSSATNQKAFLLVPGWIRERAADVLFEPGNHDEPSIIEVMMTSLVKLPIDLRRPMASQMLVTGGLSSMPGFFTRLRRELAASLDAAQAPPPSAAALQRRTRVSPYIPRKTEKTRFSTISSLSTHVAIMNDPCMVSAEYDEELHPNSGTAAAFAPSVLPWIGASLSVAMRSTGAEVTRDQWTDSKARCSGAEDGSEAEDELPDWTATKLPVRPELSSP